MLPRKRPEVFVEDDDTSETQSFIKKHRIGSLTSATAATANDGDDSGDVKSNAGFIGNINSSNHSSGGGSVLPEMALGDGNPPDIDEDLHSRQLAVYGRETMRRLFASNILVSGMQGLGAEIVKNLVLAGVKSVTLHDEGAVELWDLSSNFIFSENDVGKNRALASVQKLQELNNAVVISTLTTKLTKEQLSNFQAVVFTDVNQEQAIEFNDYCHNHGPPIASIKAEVRRLFGSVFCDFGPEFTVFDVDGEEQKKYQIKKISLSHLQLSLSASMSSSSLPLSFNHPLFPRPQPPPPDLNLSPFPISKPFPHSLSRSLICFSLPPSNNSNYEREEARWLREEQRWLREEQRWLRQESLWHAERESLIREISALKLRIQELESHQSEFEGVSVLEVVKKVAALLQGVKEGEVGRNVNWIAESGSSAVPMVLDVVKEVIGEGKEVKRTTLRKGSEGEDVRAIQEALHKLGFYSGEEDMEYSSFSSGTERAVKTWQATLGAPEDGIMTAELQERLYIEQQIGGSGLAVNADPKGNDRTGLPKEVTNGAVVASRTEISEIQGTVVEEAVTEIEVSHERVFLLGENRWEDPSRLTGRNKQVGADKSKDSTTRCLSCQGVGRVLCAECDGTGEPNIEPQFLEWIDDGAKCPYCNGLRFTICDVCEGKAVV